MSESAMVRFILALNVLQQSSIWGNRLVLSLIALSLGADPLAVGVLGALFSLFPATLAVSAGQLADRHGARRFLMLGSAGSGLGMFMPLLFPSLPSVLFAGAMTGLATVFFNVTTQSLTGQWSDPQRRARHFANYSLSSSAGTLIGPLIGGFAMEHLAQSATCVLMGVLAMVSLVMLIVLGRPLEPQGRRIAPPPKLRFRDSLQMLADPAVRVTMVCGSLFSAGLNLFHSYMPVYGKLLALPDSVIGIIVALNAVAAFAIRAVLPRLIARLGEQGALTAALVVSCIGVALIPAFEHPWMLGLLSLLFGLGLGAGQPVVTQLTYQNSPPGRTGEAIGLKVTGNHAVSMASPLMFGSIATHFGLGPRFLACAALMAGGSWLSEWHRRGTEPSRSR